jgi:HAE1 family hydrophobic/amphiphilic exporter-1
MMTTATTVLALLPMAVGLGAGDELRMPLAITVIGGLTVATVLTLVVTPCLYRVMATAAVREVAPVTGREDEVAREAGASPDLPSGRVE